MDRFQEANRQKWNELAEVNYTSRNSDYGVEAFLGGSDNTRDLHKTELEELGSVEGLDILSFRDGHAAAGPEGR